MKFPLSITAPLAALILLSSNCVGQNKSIKDSIHFFEGTWKQAVAKANADNKHIFFDAFASWCVPCKTMEAEIYTDPRVAEYFNKNFICFKADMEKGEGPELAKRFTSIDGYPSLLFFDSNGNLNKTLLGSRHAGDFLNEAKLVAEPKNN